MNKMKIISNTEVVKGLWKMMLGGGHGKVTRPGQFVNIKLPDRFLRRPISICDWDDETLTLLYKVVGEGTADMSRMEVGTELDVLGPLGNGFDIEIEKMRHPLVVGGGVGVPPLYGLCKALVRKGCVPTMVMGFNTASEVILYDEFKALGIDVFVTTMDGTGGEKGVVTDAMSRNAILSDYFYCCGPRPMIEALKRDTMTEGQISMEERMGCGFGACVGCTIETKNGFRRVCADGPVFLKSELL